MSFSATLPPTALALDHTSRKTPPMHAISTLAPTVTHIAAIHAFPVQELASCKGGWPLVIKKGHRFCDYKT
jgi:hypothetical protein